MARTKKDEGAMLSSSTRSFSVSPPLSPECPNILIFMTSPASLFRTRALHSRIAPSGSLREDPDSSGLITHIESHPEGITCKIEWPAACSQADAQQMENRTKAAEAHESHSSLPFGSIRHALRCSVVAHRFLLSVLFSSSFFFFFFRPRSTRTESGKRDGSNLAAMQQCSQCSLQGPLVLPHEPLTFPPESVPLPPTCQAPEPPHISPKRGETSTEIARQQRLVTRTTRARGLGEAAPAPTAEAAAGN